MRTDREPKLVDVIREDLRSNTGWTFNHVLEAFEQRTGADDIFGSAESNLIGLVINSQYKLDFRRPFNNGAMGAIIETSRLDEHGRPSGTTYTFRHIPSSDRQLATFIDGSSPLSGTGCDVTITPEELADQLESVLDEVNEYNWKITFGSLYKPEGEI